MASEAEDEGPSGGLDAFKRFWRTSVDRSGVLAHADGAGWEWTASAYVVDWGVGIVAVLVTKLYLEPMQPYERDITPYLDDPNLRWPFARRQRVSLSSLDDLTIALPILLSTLLCLLSYFTTSTPSSRSLIIPTLHHTYLSFLTSQAIMVIPLVLLKNYVGRLRPDFLSRCVPSLSAPFVCTGPPAVVAEGRRSFPSGHASQSFCGLGWLALWIAGRNGAFVYGGDGLRGTGPLQSRLLRGAGAGIWVALASYIAVSRLEDHMHHPTDVLFGSLLGILCALVAYHIYFPSPFSARHFLDLGKPRLVYAHRLPVPRTGGDQDERRWLLDEQHEVARGKAKATDVGAAGTSSS